MIPYSRPKLSDLYTLSHSKLLENPTLHRGMHITYIAHIWQYRPRARMSLNRTFGSSQNLLQNNRCIKNILILLLPAALAAVTCLLYL